MSTSDRVRHAFQGVNGPYQTHRPVLCEALLRVPSGLILELGAGEGSTPALHEVSQATGRTVVTLESDASWIARFATLRSDNHHLVHLPSWIDLDGPHVLKGLTYAVAFVDHAPAGRRVADIAWLATCARVVVVHDTEDPIYGYAKILGLFKYAATYKKHTPWTSVFSNSIDVASWTFQ